MKKIISILVLAIILVCILSNVVFAGSANDPIGAMKGYESGANSQKLNTIGGKIYGIILVVGGAVAAGTFAIMAIRFMSASPQEKADVKKDLIGFTVGVLILFGVIGILGIFQSIGTSFNS